MDRWLEQGSVGVGMAERVGFKPTVRRTTTVFDLALRSPPWSPLATGRNDRVFLATMISLIALMDNPFRGEVGVSAEAFQLVYDQLMKE